MKKLIVTLALAALAACSSDNDLSPQEECELYVDAICDRTVDCVAGTSFAQCQSALDAQFDCFNETRPASPNFGFCLDDIDLETCDVLFQPDGNGDLEFIPPDTCDSF